MSVRNSSSSRAQPPYDLIYGVPRGAELPPGGPVVDYDLNRLHTVADREIVIAELPDFEGRAERLLFNALPHTPMSQLMRDFAAAGRLLYEGGSVRVEAHDRKAAKRIGKMLREAFAVVHKEHGEIVVYHCSLPLDPEIEVELGEVTYTDPANGRSYRFATRPGLFGHRAVDPGSRLLLAHLGEVAEERVLDFGCGYGVLGVVAAGRGARMVMIDSDLRAVEMARQNLAAHGLQGKVEMLNDLSSVASSSFDRVVSNPPTHAGSDVLRRMFTEMVRVTEGTARIVVREHLNYEKWLRELGGVTGLAIGDDYKVLEFPSGG